MEDRLLTFTGIFPDRDVAHVDIIAQGFMIFGLEGLVEMTAARFPAGQGVQEQDIGKLQEVRV